jgi:hypothetical protein
MVSQAFNGCDDNGFSAQRQVITAETGLQTVWHPSSPWQVFEWPIFDINGLIGPFYILNKCSRVIFLIIIFNPISLKTGKQDRDLINENSKIEYKTSARSWASRRTISHRK